jgi:hypothetical protein
VSANIFGLKREDIRSRYHGMHIEENEGFGTCNGNAGYEIPTLWCGISGGTLVWEVGTNGNEEYIKIKQREAECEGRFD